MTHQPSYFIPHDGGPCFFMPDPAGTWTGMERFLRDLPSSLPEQPRAILVASGHWELKLRVHRCRTAQPDLRRRQLSATLLREAGLGAQIDADRGLDHGVFVPLKVAFPDADIAIVEMSVEPGLAPAFHIAAGRALAPLREECVLILGAGMSFHTMRAYGDPASTDRSHRFDDWLDQVGSLAGSERAKALEQWARAPHARFAHLPAKEEHLLPLMVAAGTSEKHGARVCAEEVLATAISGFRFA